VSVVAPDEFRLRICYRKEGRLRFLSHLEVSRAIERSARRAGMPYAVTRGFTPRLKAAFGPALPVGTAGQREYVDVWLTRYVPADELVGRLRGAAPEGLEPVRAGYVSDALPSLSAACTIAEYEVVIEGDGLSADQVHDAVSTVVADGELTVSRKGKVKVFDLDRSLPKEPKVGSHDRQILITMTTRMGPEGSLRPDQLVEEAFRRTGLPGSIARITRTETLIETEDGMRRPL